MAKNWLQKLQNIEGAVTERANPHERVIRTSSPSVNATFGKGWGLPFGLTLALGGPPKGGKTLVTKSITGQLHADYPEMFALKYNTEFRTNAQATPEEDQRIWGIDPDRYQEYEVNSPMLIFDKIEKEVAAMCQDGMPLGLVIVDSIDGVQGRRAMNADTVETQQIGDWALTLGDGFKRILPIQRKYNFAVILTCQIRSEMDLLEQKRGNRFKMKLPLSVQHYAEYFMYVEPNRNKEGRTDLSGKEFKSEDVEDVAGNAEQTGHKIRVKMKDSSCGPKGRGGEFTLDYRRGIINRHEEVFLLGTGRQVIERPNNMSYGFGDQKWVGKAAMLDALRDSPQLQDEILAEIKRRDNAGAYEAADAAEQEEGA